MRFRRGFLIPAARALPGSGCIVSPNRVDRGTLEFEFTRFRSDYGGGFLELRKRAN